MRLLGWNTFFLLLLQLVFLPSNALLPSDHEAEDLSVEEIMATWIKMSDKLKNLVAYGLGFTTPKVKRYLMNLNLTEQCKKETEELFEGLRNFKPWALRFMDSSGKMIDGIMYGTLYAPGVFEECLETVAVSEDNGAKSSTLFKGQYCTIDFKPATPSENQYPKLQKAWKNMNFSGEEEFLKDFPDYVPFFYFLSLRLGICVPSGCTLKDINEVGKSIGDPFYIKAKAKNCMVDQKIQLPPSGIFTLCCYSVLIFFVVMGSMLDLYFKDQKSANPSKLVQVLLAFSFIKNFKKLINTETRSQHLTCLNGVRFLSISWIILGHSYFLVNFQIVTGLSKIRDIFGDGAFQVVANGTYAVDTFFVMGGLLSSYLMITKVKIEGHPFSILLYIFHRIWRIMPTYIFVLLLTFASGITEFGPLYKEHLAEHVDGCYENWWANLLFINNFFSYTNMCLRHSWYISCDFQLYLIALLILMPFVKSSKIGISLSIFGVLISVIYSAIITYGMHYPPVFLLFESLKSIGDYFMYFYASPFAHLGPYCIGILSGYILASKPKLHIPKKIQMTGWCLALMCNLAVIYGAINWNRGEKATEIESITYSAFSRTGWALGVAWVIICCATGHGGIANYILSWPVFIPLGRLTFCAYLLHPIIEILLLGNLYVLLPANQILAVWLYFGHLCLTFGAAFFATMIIEAPFLSLEKIILSKRKEASNEKTMNSTTEKDHNAKNLAFNEGLSAQDLYKNCTIIENKDVMSKL